MRDNAVKIDFYFDEPLMEMTFAERIIVRIIHNILAGVFIVLTATFFLSPVRSLSYLGFLMAIFLADRFFHAWEPRKFLNELPRSGRVNGADYISPHLRRSLILSHEKWFVKRGNFTLHLIDVLLGDESVRRALTRLDVNLEEFRRKLHDYSEKSNLNLSHSEVNALIRDLVLKALAESVDSGNIYIGSAALFAAAAESNDSEVAKLMSIFGVWPADLTRVLIFSHTEKSGISHWFAQRAGKVAARGLRIGSVNRAWTSRPTPRLDAFSIDYSVLAGKELIGFMIGHQNEYERVLNILSKQTNPNALLVGEPGSGKETIVQHLAYMISRDEVPPTIFDRRLVALDAGRLITATDMSELRLNLQNIFDEVARAKNVILYIGDLQSLIEPRGENESGVASGILSMILESRFPLIAAVTSGAFKKYIEPNKGLTETFEIIPISEISAEDAIKLIIYASFSLERDYRVEITYSAIKKSVDLALKYFHASPLPGSALNLLKEALTSVNRHGDKIISADDVVDVAQTRVNIPIKSAGKAEEERLLNLEDIIHTELVDQEDAVKAVSEALREYRSGLSRRGGPIGAFLFVGPTGVGKTELAKILAKLQFGSESEMIRFDMSGYQDKQSFFQFIGSPDGRIAGALTDGVLEKPYSIVLLDEFEKAHPDILNIFLSIFDDGRITDNVGRVVSFENTIIIATSNAGSDYIKSELEKGGTMAGISAGVKKRLASFFKPELVNRFSGIVLFKELSRADILEIARRSLAKLSRDLMASKNIELEFSPEAISKIAELGYDPVFGARPLREVVSVKIKDPLARLILSESLSRGSKVKVGLEAEGFKFNVN